MRIGYPCINRSIGCTANHTFRLKNYSTQRLFDTVEQNLQCLLTILKYNTKHDIRFFRITSGLIPFASHPVCTANWRERFASTFQQVGRYVRRHGMRISMHPDQFVLFNAKDPAIVAAGIGELGYHAEVLDVMGLGPSAKIVIHVGGVYGDREASLQRFADVYEGLDRAIKRRLVIENDDVRYPLTDCLKLSNHIGIPVVFDYLHDQILSSPSSLPDKLDAVAATWRKTDGPPIIHYSSQQPGMRKGTHAQTVDLADLQRFLGYVRGRDLDIMLEIKDKETSALEAVSAARGQRSSAGG